MKTQHTPGPWRLSNEGDLILDSENNVLSYLVLAHLRCTKANGGLSAQVDANARLMAAAPELLEFVQYVAKGIPVWDDPCSLEESVDHLEKRAKRLVEKIEGDERRD